jgi:hypothetical protein
MPDGDLDLVVAVSSAQQAAIEARASSPRIHLTNVSIASMLWVRAASRSSGSVFGRPAGFPDLPG